MSIWDDISIAILAGGQSTRMGQDKAALEIGGAAMLVRTADLAASTGAPLCVVGRERPLDWLNSGVSQAEPRCEASFVLDQAPGLGPVGGLLSALSWNALSIRRERLLLLPCDLPLLEVSGLEWIARAASTCTARDGLATTRGGLLEPLFSIYRARIEERAAEYLKGGRRSLHGLIESGGFERRECPAEVAAQLFNCNTPQDLEAARRQARG